ncbi:hypothetical protein GCM10018965_039820 [Nonomuraea roseola]
MTPSAGAEPLNQPPDGTRGQTDHPGKRLRSYVNVLCDDVGNITDEEADHRSAGAPRAAAAGPSRGSGVGEVVAGQTRASWSACGGRGAGEGTGPQLMPYAWASWAI